MFKLLAIVAVCCIQAAFCAEVDPCSDGWKKIGSGCYLFSKQRVTWYESFRQCAKHGAQLAIPRNTAENSALGNAANKEGLYFPWIGVYRQLNKTFTTVCGSNPSFTNWKTNQPDDYAGQENCVQIIAEDTLAKWNDNVCGKKYDYICEIKIPSIKVKTDNSSRIIVIATTVEAGVFLIIILIILLVKYKQREMAAMLSTPVHEAVETAQQESLPIDQGPGYENITVVDREFYDDIVQTSAQDRTILYEEVEVPQSVQDSNTHETAGYTELDSLKRGATDDGDYQGLLKQEPEYVIPVSVEPEYETPNEYLGENEAHQEPKITP